MARPGATEADPGHARARAELEEVDETEDEVHDAVRAMLSRAPPPPPDPLTGRIVTPRPPDPGPLTAAQLHRRIMEIARLAGRESVVDRRHGGFE